MFSIMIRILLLAGAITFESSAHARSLQEDVDTLFVDYSRPGVPGCAVGLFERDRTVLAKGYGAADLAWGAPITPDTKFELGSAAKQFTALAIIMLEADGRLSRTDLVRKHLPSLPARYEGITLDHLLRHTSGVADYIQLARIAQAPALAELTRQNALELASSVPPVFAPGDDFAYSNTGYLLLADVVAAVSGTTFASFLETRIFAPLAMTDTAVIDASRPSSTRATYYEIDNDGPRDGEWRGRDAPGAWGVRSTIRDLGRYNAALTSGSSVLAPYLPRMEAAGRLNSGESVTYGAGLFVGNYRGRRTLRHTGRANVEFVRFPETGHAVALMCNRNDVDAEVLAEELADLFLGGSLLPPAPDVPTDRHGPLLGAYVSPNGEQMRIADVDGHLQLVGWGRLHAVEPGVFTAGPSTDTLRLTWPAADRGRLEARFQSSRPVLLDRFTPVAPLPAALHALVGQYRSDVLRSTYSVEPDAGGTIALIAPDRTAVPLEPLTADLFAAGSWRVRVRRSSTGAVSALEIRTSRTPALSFAKLDLSRH
ncbi:Penicillin-binding protein E [Brevundimonas vesicularis]|uniref:Penicillin-binding protein E n=1 Tax=Brevundimonas vesicularis TaxID=41276 RepID=A0A2X1D7M1_BREVE|nr:serine hydrolase domain-containing protein [Brevundimonas vesicularis]SPU54826.1 Penicillin-binding protein E [Brevundimonas vesicularis]